MTKRCGTALTVLILAAGSALGQTGAPSSTPPDQAVLSLLGNATFNNGLGFGARAMGMAGAFSAIADDASAASWNPAGLGQLIRPEVTIVGGYNKSKVTTTNQAIQFFGSTGATQAYLAFNNEDYDGKSSGVDFASVAMPFKLGKQLFTAQVSYSRNARPLDADANYRIDFFTKPGGVNQGPDYYDIAVRSTGGYDSIGVGLGSGFDDKLYIGFTLNYWYGKTTTTYDQVFRSVFVQGSGTTELSNYRLEIESERRLSGLSANVGILFKPVSQLSIGLVYRGGWSGESNGKSRLTAAGSDTFAFSDGSTKFVQFRGTGGLDSDTTLAWPSTIGGGITFRPIDPLTIALDASGTFWKRSFSNSTPRLASGCHGTLVNGVVNCTFDFASTDLEFPSLADVGTVDQNTQSAFRAGVEYVIRAGSLVVPLRVGAYRIKTIAPIYGNGDTDPGAFFTGFTGGLGFAVPVGGGSILFDAAAVFDKASTSINNLKQTADSGAYAVKTGDREVKNTRYIGSLIYRF